LTDKPNLTCAGLAVHCIDFRLQTALNRWLDDRFGPDNYDRFAQAGAVLDPQAVLRHVEIAVRLHRVNTVALINHQNCLAYGARGTYEHECADLRDLKQRLEQAYPGLLVETYYLYLDGRFEQV
jgi:carbonic anhydrase